MDSSEIIDIHAETKAWILKWCSQLKPEHIDWQNASEPSDKYNCMGFCMGPIRGKLRWWQPLVVSDSVVLRVSEGVWKSKMAEHSDFEHIPDAFDDVDFWNPPGRIFMRRFKADREKSSAAKPAP